MSISDKVVVSLTEIITASFDWFFTLVDSIGALPLIMSVFTIWTVYRFILGPLLGHMGSDVVRSKNKSKDATWS